MIIFSESVPGRDTDADIDGLTECAVAEGLRVVHVASERAAEGPLIRGLEAGPPQRGVRYGTLCTAEHYRAFYDAALALGVTLLNSPEQHLDALELDRVVGKLVGLTPDTRVVTDAAQAAAAATELGLPVFVKGSVFSRKWYGWKSCVAETAEEAEALTKKLLALKWQSRDRVMLRRLAPLKRSGATYEGFPIAREYRLFALNGEPLASGYYWPFGDPFGAPSEGDRAAIHALVRETHRRTGVPWLAVDVGQCEDGGWIVIETGDPQCSGLGNISPRPLLHALSQRLG